MALSPGSEWSGPIHEIQISKGRGIGLPESPGSRRDVEELGKTPNLRQTWVIMLSTSVDTVPWLQAFVTKCTPE